MNVSEKLQWQGGREEILCPKTVSRPLVASPANSHSRLLRDLENASLKINHYFLTIKNKQLAQLCTHKATFGIDINNAAHQTLLEVFLLPCLWSHENLCQLWWFSWLSSHIGLILEGKKKHILFWGCDHSVPSVMETGCLEYGFYDVQELTHVLLRKVRTQWMHQGLAVGVGNGEIWILY